MIPFADLKRQYQAHKKEIDACIFKNLENTSFIGGNEVYQFEKSFASFVDVNFCIACANGTDSIEILLKAMGIKQNDEVLVPAISWISTSEAVSSIGAIPVFVDVDADNYTIDTNLISSKITSKTKAIIPVHLYGQMADINQIMNLASEYGLTVIEDAAQSRGTELRGKKAGNFGDFGCFSFFPSKNLGAYGDAGLITVKDKDFAEKVDILRLHGARPKYHNKYIGMNSRLDALQAAVLSVKLTHLDNWSSTRREKALNYNRLFVDAGIVQEPKDCLDDCTCLGKQQCDLADDLLMLPVEKEGDPAKGGKHIYHQYTIRVKHRDEVLKKLKERGIGSAVYYPVPMHMQECYSMLGYKEEDLPHTVCAANQALSLPMYPELTPEQQVYVVEQLKLILNESN